MFNDKEVDLALTLHIYRNKKKKTSGIKINIKSIYYIFSTKLFLL